MSGATATRGKPSATFVELTDTDVAGITSDAVASVQVKGKLTNLPMVRRVTLADGRKVFKCALCNYANTKGASITPHQRVHSPEDRAAKAAELGIVGYGRSSVTVRQVQPEVIIRKRGPYKKRIKKTEAATPVVPAGTEVAFVAGNGEAEIMGNLEAFIVTRNGQVAELTSERDIALIRIRELETIIADIHDVLHDGRSGVPL
jgi:hypothetical protein